MAKVRVDRKVLGMVSTNCYFVQNTDTGETVIVDPADNAQSIIDYAEKNRLIPKAVFLTHGHFDHIMAARRVCDSFSIKSYCYLDEKEVAASPSMNLSTAFMDAYALEVDETFTDNEEVSMAGMRFAVLHTPGHTKGSCCYYMPDNGILLSGDTIFCESVGRTDFPTGSQTDIIESIKNKIFTLKDDVIIYPGHGDETSVGYEKINNCVVPYISN